MQEFLERWLSGDRDVKILDLAIDTCKGEPFIYKFISPNDVGATGAHQSGFYIPTDGWNLIFDSPGKKGENKDRRVRIRWNDERETDSRFIWYGKETRSEYRLTQFGREFPYLQDDFIGSFLILTETGEDSFSGFILSSEEDIEQFKSQFGLSPLQTAGFWQPEQPLKLNRMEVFFGTFLKGIPEGFPTTKIMATAARDFCDRSGISGDSDSRLMSWLAVEYKLYQYVENVRYAERLKISFDSLNELLNFSSSVLNRRKSRAGSSLEHQLAAMFHENNLPFAWREKTEGNRTPDFIFPGIQQYHNADYPSDSLVFLGAKTTCKDRWRQILDEADRIKIKHLFTLQPGISENQLDEMQEKNVHLVVPQENLNSYPPSRRHDIMTLGSFIEYVQDTIIF